MPSSPVSPRDLALKEKKFSSIEDVEAAFNIAVRRLNEVYKYNRRDHDRLTQDVEDVTGVSALCRAYLSENQTLVDSAETLVELDTESYDPDSVFDTTTHKITVPSDGYYLFTFQLYFTSTTAEGRHKGILGLGAGGSNRVSTINYAETGISSHHYLNFADIQYMTQGTIVGLWVSGPTGGGTTLGSAAAGTWMSMAKLV